MYRELAYVISFAPYYWRAMQVLENTLTLLKNLYFAMPCVRYVGLIINILFIIYVLVC